MVELYCDDVILTLHRLAIQHLVAVRCRSIARISL